MGEAFRKPELSRQTLNKNYAISLWRPDGRAGPRIIEAPRWLLLGRIKD